MPISFCFSSASDIHNGGSKEEGHWRRVQAQRAGGNGTTSKHRQCIEAAARGKTHINYASLSTSCSYDIINSAFHCGFLATGGRWLSSLQESTYIYCCSTAEHISVSHYVTAAITSLQLLRHFWCFHMFCFFLFCLRVL